VERALRARFSCPPRKKRARRSRSTSKKAQRTMSLRLKTFQWLEKNSENRPRRFQCLEKGRDGCPQPSVYREMRRCRDTPPYPKRPDKGGASSPSEPKADRVPAKTVIPPRIAGSDEMALFFFIARILPSCPGSGTCRVPYPKFEKRWSGRSARAFPVRCRRKRARRSRSTKFRRLRRRRRPT
jgi:hypothetical protein